MATEDVHLIWALDKSGSMGSVRDQTIASFNTFMEEQDSLPGKAYLSLTLFDTVVTTRFQAASLKLVPPMEPAGINGYQPNGGTALYDGVAIAITTAEQWHADNPSFDGKVVVIILTDGVNTGSKTTLDDVNELIKRKGDDGWEFIFLGSGGSAWTEGKNFKVDQAMTVNYAGDGQATQDVYAGVSASVGAFRKGFNLRDAMVTNTAHLNADPTKATVDPDPVRDVQP